MIVLFPRLAAVLTCTALVGCALEPVRETVPGEPYVRGAVEAFAHRATASSLLVRGGPGSREPCGISATADRQTRYLERDQSGTLRQTDRSAIGIGDTVEVYVEGPVAESCPVQGRASVVVRVARS